VSAIFDGTTQFGEALAIVLCYIKNETMHQRLVRLVLLAKPVTGDELAREFLRYLLSTELGVSGEIYWLV